MKFGDLKTSSMDLEKKIFLKTTQYTEKNQPWWAMHTMDDRSSSWVQSYHVIGFYNCAL